MANFIVSDKAKCRPFTDVAAARSADDVRGIGPIAKCADMSPLHGQRERDNAHRRLLVFLRLPELRKIAAADAGSLLRILFVRQRAVPADAGKPALLLKRLARPTNQVLAESNARSRRRNHKPMAAMTVKTAPA